MVLLFSGIGILLPREVDAVDQRVAREVLALLGEGDDGEIVQAEIVRGRQRHGELPPAAVDDEEVRGLPRGDRPRGGGSLTSERGLAGRRLLRLQRATEAAREHLVHRRRSRRSPARSRRARRRRAR